ncbi:hypothetical protein D0N50_13180 [Erwinia billingiae]|uniref:hypothetical protein n=1 Tax=Erwinia billingiae TaxID=182337 RepID=UPI0012451BE6|nr:hypothetical protein [Erwinia billingiae]QEW32575.1 hypothetical protein D0N50_13180 [Erwinia billingiae]
MQKNKKCELVTLIYRCSFVFFCICFVANFIGSVMIYFKVGSLLFDWKETTLLSLKKGLVIGVTLGVGLWIKARLQERKDKKSLSK